MAEAIRYHLDEHIATAVAVGLRSRGIDVTTTLDAQLTVNPTYLSRAQPDAAARPASFAPG
jgi:hypothetical protein